MQGEARHSLRPADSNLMNKQKSIVFNRVNIIFINFYLFGPAATLYEPQNGLSGDSRAGGNPNQRVSPGLPRKIWPY